MRILGNADLQRWMQSCGAEYTGKQKSLWKNSIGFGGDPRGARTHDPNIKSVVLYQLS